MADGPDGTVLLDTVMAADPTGQPEPLPRSRRRSLLLFSVRGMLFLVLVTGCGLGWITHIIRSAQIQRRAVAAVYQAGGWALYDTEWDESQNPSTWKLRWPRWLVDRFGKDYFGNVIFINLHDRGTDAVLEHVGKLEHLKQLHRPGLAVTDVGLARLKPLKNLQFLSLDDTQVTDEGLTQLKGLSGLKWLKLTHTKVTDAGVAAVGKSLPHLRMIR